MQISHRSVDDTNGHKHYDMRVMSSVEYSYSDDATYRI